MKYLYLSFFVILIFIPGCTKENPVEPDNTSTTGAIVLKIDRENAPASVVSVTAQLIRPGFTPIVSEMNLLSDSTADLTLNNIPVGGWLLKVEAKNQSGVVEYRGQTEVNILENQTIQVSLVLQPVTGGTGNIYLFVTWGTQSIWKDFSGNPVLTPLQNPSYPTYVTQSKVIYDNGVYKMWYNAVYSNAVVSIWYAESADGKNWNTIGNQPVLTTSPGKWDSYTVTVLHVLKEPDNSYKMYYHGFNGHPYESAWRIGVAFSTDGINWTKHPQPIMDEAAQYFRIGMTSVVKHDGIYYGYFAYANSSLTNTYIGAASSTDGINWTYYNNNPVLSSTQNWEGQGVQYPSVIYDNGKFKLCYENWARSGFGMAESTTPYNFTKNSTPIFRNTNSKWNVITYPNFIRLNTEYRIYYYGENGNVPNGIGFIFK